MNRLKHSLFCALALAAGLEAEDVAGVDRAVQVFDTAAARRRSRVLDLHHLTGVGIQHHATASARRAISWTPAKALDNILGALVNVLALAIVVWIIASAIAFLPASAVSEQVSRSRLLSSMDAVEIGRAHV